MERSDYLDYLINKYNPSKYSIHSYKSDFTSNGVLIVSVSFIRSVTNHVSMEDFEVYDDNDEKFIKNLEKYYEFI